MYCRKCGELIPDDSSFCYTCGEKIIVMKEENTDNPNVQGISYDDKKANKRYNKNRSENTLIRDYLIGNNKDFYIREFQKIELGRKAKFSWVGFVFFFWALYRKMYKEAFVNLAVNAGFGLAFFILMRENVVGRLDIFTCFIAIIIVNFFVVLIIPLIFGKISFKLYYSSITRRIDNFFDGEMYVEDLSDYKKSLVKNYNGTLKNYIVVVVLISSTILGYIGSQWGTKYINNLLSKSLNLEENYSSEDYSMNDYLNDINTDSNKVSANVSNDDLSNENNVVIDNSVDNDSTTMQSTGNFPSEGYYSVQVYVDGSEYTDDTNDKCVLMLTKKDGEEYTYTTDFTMGRPTIISINSNGTCNIVQDILESNVGSWSRDNGIYTFTTEDYTLQLKYLFSLGNTTKSIGNMNYFNYTYNDYNDLCEFQFVAPSFLVQSYTSLDNYVDFVNIATDDFGMYIETLSNPDNYSCEEMLNKCIEDYGNVSYKVIKDNYFIISGLDGNEIYYHKYYVLSDAIVSIQISYLSQYKELYSNVVSEIANGFIVR